jgi:hypothetical protein
MDEVKNQSFIIIQSIVYILVFDKDEISHTATIYPKNQCQYSLESKLTINSTDAQAFTALAQYMQDVSSSY